MSFNKICNDIKSLKIQGAENVAKAAIKALKIKHDTKSIKKLISLRPTEPLLRNSITFAKKNDFNNLNKILEHLKESQKKISRIGSKKIKNKSVVFTHCHSSTVINILKEAKKTKKFQVYNTETRPLFQGRKTAKELLKLKIPVTHFIDSAARHYLKESDIVLIGADAITSEGYIINKIGTEMITDLAKEYSIPVYVCANSWKFDPKTLNGFEEKIEQRNPKEVWSNAPKKIKIKNPSFETVCSEDITAIISELGVLKPASFVSKVITYYPWIQGKR
jgi:ribose 1,5-bisphosphate isomerase